MTPSALMPDRILPPTMAPNASGDDDLDPRFDAIALELREDIERLRGHVDEFRAAHQEIAEGARATEDRATIARLQADRLRLQRLDVVAASIESSLAYLVGAAPAPGEQDESRQITARVLYGLEADRQRLYREVHDGPAQVLTNAIFELEFFQRLADRAPADLRAQLLSELASLREQLRGSLENVRAMIFDLRPPALAQLGLVEAMRAYAAEFGSRHGLAVDLDLRAGPTGLAPERELAIYRVLQEALQNVHRHSSARRVKVSWQRSGGRWTLAVVDDGVGFDVAEASARTQSYGLLTMRERAEVIGGSFDVRSAPGQGTAVNLSVAA